MAFHQYLESLDVALHHPPDDLLVRGGVRRGITPGNAIFVLRQVLNGQCLS